MARFYFHIRLGDNHINDPDGSELTDAAEAIAEATEDVRHLLAERIRLGTKIKPWVIEISDEEGVVQAEVGFHDVLLSLIER
jgi:hypothetical protein